MPQFILTLVLGLMFSLSALAQDLALEGFNKRFNLVRDDSGKVVAIKMKRVVSHFTIAPYLEQIKQDLLAEQRQSLNVSDSVREAEINEMLIDLGANPFIEGEGAEEARRTRESLLHLNKINVETAFRQLNHKQFWKEFERKLNEAFLFIDPTMLTNHEDARFFYKRQVTYKVVVWALQQAKKHFSSVPVLNIASFVIVRVHDMMMEQRHFHHNMLLHYFEVIPEAELGMTKEEIDRAVSSIYEYRIDAANIMESNRAARDWLNYGMNTFYMTVRSGNARIRNWESALSSRFQNVKKLNWGFAEVTENGGRKIYHLHSNVHQFSKNPALGHDFTDPKKVRRHRSLLNLAGVGLGFIQMPGWLKGNVDNFIKSFYVQQVRLEGALVGHFESTGNSQMIRHIYGQRANFYILE